jgi:ribonuclease HI
MVTFYADGRCEPGRQGGRAFYAWVGLNEYGIEQWLDYGLLFDGPEATSNTAEYGAVIKALRFAQRERLTGARVYSDSQIVVYQVNGDFDCRTPSLLKYRNAARWLLKVVCGTMMWIPRDQNARADALSRRAYRRVMWGGR